MIETLPRISRVWAMPNSETFDIPPIGQFVKSRLEKSNISVDPYARNKRWATYTNDLNPKTEAEYHMDATNFLLLLKEKGVQADLAIIDPPYSPRQIKECYDSIGLKVGPKEALLGRTRKILKAALVDVLTPNATVLWFGWNTVGMGKCLGFTLTEILLVCHGSDHNDTICVCEQRNYAR